MSPSEPSRSAVALAASPATTPSAARRAGRTVLILCGIITSLVGVIVTARVRSGGSISALSLAMPLTGLGWLCLLGIKISRHRDAPLAAESLAVSDRPSRRPPSWDGVPGPKPSQRPGPDRQVNA